jgi:ribosome-binding protein aMBF1 (putative translation factor)
MVSSQSYFTLRIGEKMLNKSNVKNIKISKFGKTFRLERLRAGVTIEKVAAKIGRSSGIVRFVETGFRNPSLETRIRMEKVLASNFKGIH